MKEPSLVACTSLSPIRRRLCRLLTANGKARGTRLAVSRLGILKEGGRGTIRTKKPEAEMVGKKQLGTSMDGVVVNYGPCAGTRHVNGSGEANDTIPEIGIAQKRDIAKSERREFEARVLCE
ncbi:hypothetical protein L6164_001135 [Bauhinia variegata]|uniref:Uncharacterized protein n=1 Tax=Bauhinia variegata TaxID=167791 RepID=A0ACB9QAR7_BAUVA|nr:hypothetical protein L6164_001135 [Bauhinia variegata]